MPYCMYFHKGLALHGSDDIPGYRASHGCVRMFTRDAKWLNEEWVEASNERNHFMGTKVVIRPVKTPLKSSRAGANSPGKMSNQASNGNLWIDPDRFPPSSAEKKQ